MEAFNINDLPGEILQHIFSLLAVSDRLRVCLVCKKWLNIVNSRYLLRDVIVNVGDSEKMLNINTGRKFFNYSFKKILFDNGHYQLLRNILSTVEYICINQCSVDKRQTSLNDLSFDNLKVLKLIVSDFWILFPYIMPKLTELHLYGNDIISDDGLAILQKSMKKLKILTLQCAVNYDPRSYKRFYPQNSSYEKNPSPYTLSLPAVKSFITERVNTLKELNLFFNMTSKALEEISSIQNLCLHKIDLENCHNCVKGIITLFKNQPSLKSLNLNGILGLNSNIITALCNFLPNIEEVDIGSGSFTDDSLNCIFQLKKLKKLNICNSYATESGFSRAVKNFEPTYLKHLNMANVKVPNSLLLINKCKNLVYLDISYCIVSDELLHFISENLFHLEYLSLRQTDITDYGLTGNAELILTKSGLENVVHHKPISNLKGLKVLHLSLCKNLTDSGIVNAVRFPNLKHLDLVGCYISQHTAEILLQENPNLDKLSQNFLEKIINQQILDYNEINWRVQPEPI